MNLAESRGGWFLKGKRMDIDEIRKLIELMVENDLSELDIADGDASVRLCRGPAGMPVVASPAPVATSPSPASATGEPATVKAAEAAPAEKLIEIKSPMVGTFYTAPGPDTEAFVSVGSPIAEDTVVSVIEAMKVMNEIKAECTGTVAEVCVANAQPVEFGQVLFRVRPA